MASETIRIEEDVKTGDSKRFCLQPVGCDSRALRGAALRLLRAALLSLPTLERRWWVMLSPAGFVYSSRQSISWNINGISHNFIHNPYFRWPLLNRLFSVMESISCCFSQVYYDVVHMQHHKGNSDRQDEQGDTVDWLSIYRHGHDGQAENPWTYTFLSFFRDSPGAIAKELAKRGNAEARWGKIELADADLRHSRRRNPAELALCDLLLSAVHVFRPLPELPEWLLSALRRKSRQADRLGSEQLPQAI